MSGRLLGKPTLRTRSVSCASLPGNHPVQTSPNQGHPALFEVTFTLCQDLCVGKGTLCLLVP